MTRSVCAIVALAGVVAGGNAAWAADTPATKDRQQAAGEAHAGAKVAEQRQPTAGDGAAPATARGADSQHASNPSPGPFPQGRGDDPRIVVHVGAAAANLADSRVQVGDVRISMPRWNVDSSTTATTATSVDAQPAGAAITVPNNTLGPGEPLWRINERRDAERRAAAANAEFAEAQAAQANRDVGHDSRFGYFGGAYFPRVWTGGFGYGGWRNRHDGLRGPVTTTITRSDLLGSTAQQAWADAAYPRLNGTTDARDAIVSQFGRDATPPIVRIQNDMDQAHTNGSKERPAK